MNQTIINYAKKLKERKYPLGKTRGACLEASALLFEHFDRQDVNCSVQFGYYGERVKENGHAWFEYWDEELKCLIIVDITADQFDPKVGLIFGSANELLQYSYGE